MIRILLAVIALLLSSAVGRYIAGAAARPFAISGAWSVRLRSGGFHTAHVHPEGWISSACYIAL
ncbi:MAG TPA: putative 2OG-Fe(II) oxygenase, partial [Usitatibacter sp.]